MLFKTPSISSQHPHPTSLSYLYDTDTEQAYFYSYDRYQSGWVDDMFEQTTTKDQLNDFWQKYQQPVKQIKSVSPVIKLPAIEISAHKPLRQGKHQVIELSIKANSETEVLEIFTQQDITVHQFSIDGRSVSLKQPLKLLPNQRLLRYYFNGKKQINLTLETSHDQVIDWQVQSHSLNLLQNSKFDLPNRPTHQIPKPFVKSDNTAVVQSFKFGTNH